MSHLLVASDTSERNDGKEVSRDEREKLDLSTQKQHVSSDLEGLSNSVSSPYES